MGCLFFKSPFTTAQEKAIINKKAKRKIVMIGLDNAGKSLILNQMKVGQFLETVPTIGLNIETVKYKTLDFLVFDVGGKVRSLWQHYYENLDAIIFVIDSTDRERIFTVKEELVKLYQDIKYQDAVILALFNKQDIPNCLDYKSLVEETGINEIFENDIIVQKCSAKTGEGLFEGIDKLANYFIQHDKLKEEKEKQFQEKQKQYKHQNFDKSTKK